MSNKQYDKIANMCRQMMICSANLAMSYVTVSKVNMSKTRCLMSGCLALRCLKSGTHFHWRHKRLTNHKQVACEFIVQILSQRCCYVRKSLLLVVAETPWKLDTSILDPSTAVRHPLWQRHDQHWYKHCDIRQPNLAPNQKYHLSKHSRSVHSYTSLEVRL